MTMCANADPPPAAADALATEVYALAYRLLQNPTLERFLHHTFRCACSHGKALRTEEMPVAGFRQFCIDIGLCSLAGPADSRAIPLEQLMQSWPQWSSALPASEQDAAALRQGQELREVIAFGLDQSKHRFIQPAARQDSEVEGLALAVRDAWPGLQFGAPAPDAARADARDAARAPPLVMGHESVQRLFDAAAHRGDHLRRTGFAVALVQLSQYLHPRLCVVRPAQAFGAFLAGYLVPYVRRQGAHALPGAVKALPDAHLRRLVQTHAAAFDVLFDHYTRPTGDGNPHAWVDPRGGRHLTMRGWERFGQDFGCVAAVADAKDAFRLVEGVMYPEQEAVLDKAAFLLLTVHVATREYPHDVHCDRLPTLAAKYQHLTEKMAPLCQSLVEMARDDEPGAAGLPSVASVDPPSGPDMEEHVVELQGKWTGVGSGHGLYVRFGDVVAYTQEVAGAKARVLAPPQSAVGVAVTVFQQAEGWQSRVTRVRSVPLAVSTDGVHYSKPGAAVYTYEQPPHQYPLLDYSAQLFQIFNRYTTLGNPANHQFLYLKEWRQFRKDFGVRTPKAIAAVACADTTVPAEDQLFYHFMTKPKRPPKGGKGPPGVALTFPGFLACAVAIAVDLVDDFETGMQVLLGVDQMHVARDWPAGGRRELATPFRRVLNETLPGTRPGPSSPRGKDEGVWDLQAAWPTDPVRGEIADDDALLDELMEEYLGMVRQAQIAWEQEYAEIHAHALRDETQQRAELRRQASQRERSSIAPEGSLVPGPDQRLMFAMDDAGEERGVLQGLLKDKTERLQKLMSKEENTRSKMKKLLNESNVKFQDVSSEVTDLKARVAELEAQLGAARAQLEEKAANEERAKINAEQAEQLDYYKKKHHETSTKNAMLTLAHKRARDKVQALEESQLSLLHTISEQQRLHAHHMQATIALVTQLRYSNMVFAQMHQTLNSNQSMAVQTVMEQSRSEAISQNSAFTAQWVLDDAEDPIKLQDQIAAAIERGQLLKGRYEHAYAQTMAPLLKESTDITGVPMPPAFEPDAAIDGPRRRPGPAASKGLAQQRLKRVAELSAHWGRARSARLHRSGASDQEMEDTLSNASDGGSGRRKEKGEEEPQDDPKALKESLDSALVQLKQLEPLQQRTALLHQQRAEVQALLALMEGPPEPQPSPARKRSSAKLRQSTAKLRQLEDAFVRLDETAPLPAQPASPALAADPLADLIPASLSRGTSEASGPAGLPSTQSSDVLKTADARTQTDPPGVAHRETQTAPPPKGSPRPEPQPKLQGSRSAAPAPAPEAKPNARLQKTVSSAPSARVRASQLQAPAGAALRRLSKADATRSARSTPSARNTAWLLEGPTHTNTQTRQRGSSRRPSPASTPPLGNSARGKQQVVGRGSIHLELQDPAAPASGRTAASGPESPKTDRSDAEGVPRPDTLDDMALALGVDLAITPSTPRIPSPRTTESPFEAAAAPSPVVPAVEPPGTPPAPAAGPPDAVLAAAAGALAAAAAAAAPGDAAPVPRFDSEQFGLAVQEFSACLGHIAPVQADPDGAGGAPAEPGLAPTIITGLQRLIDAVEPTFHQAHTTLSVTHQEPQLLAAAQRVNAGLHKATRWFRTVADDHQRAELLRTHLRELLRVEGLMKPSSLPKRAPGHRSRRGSRSPSLRMAPAALAAEADCDITVEAPEDRGAARPAPPPNFPSLGAHPEAFWQSLGRPEGEGGVSVRSSSVCTSVQLAESPISVSARSSVSRASLSCLAMQISSDPERAAAADGGGAPREAPARGGAGGGPACPMASASTHGPCVAIDRGSAGDPASPERLDPRDLGDRADSLHSWCTEDEEGDDDEPVADLRARRPLGPGPEPTHARRPTIATAAIAMQLAARLSSSIRGTLSPAPRRGMLKLPKESKEEATLRDLAELRQGLRAESAVRALRPQDLPLSPVPREASFDYAIPNADLHSSIADSVQDGPAAAPQAAPHWRAPGGPLSPPAAAAPRASVTPLDVGPFGFGDYPRTGSAGVHSPGLSPPASAVRKYRPSFSSPEPLEEDPERGLQVKPIRMPPLGGARVRPGERPGSTETGSACSGTGSPRESPRSLDGVQVAIAEEATGLPKSAVPDLPTSSPSSRKSAAKAGADAKRARETFLPAITKQ